MFGQQSPSVNITLSLTCEVHMLKSSVFKFELCLRTLQTPSVVTRSGVNRDIIKCSNWVQNWDTRFNAMSVICILLMSKYFTPGRHADMKKTDSSVNSGHDAILKLSISRQFCAIGLISSSSSFMHLSRYNSFRFFRRKG